MSLDDPTVQRCPRALAGEGGTTLDDLASCYRSAGPASDPWDVSYRAYAAERLGVPTAEISAKELADLHRRIERGERAEAELHRLAEAEAKTRADREAALDAEADRSGRTSPPT